MGNIRFYAASQSYYARILSLMGSNVIEDEEKEVFKEWLKEDTNDMHDLSRDIFESQHLLPDDHDRIRKDENILTWFLFGNEISYQKFSLFDSI